MTRINCVPVECLTDKHLLAEYKEITRPFNKMLKRIDKHGYINAVHDYEIPEKYTLGKGHETFFFNKLGWLFSRYKAIANELSNRGFNINWDQLDLICKDIKTRFAQEKPRGLMISKYWKFWNPTPEDMYLNMARLSKRSNLDNVLKELEV